MELSIMAISFALNVILFGCIIILLKGGFKIGGELKKAVGFATALIEYIEEKNNMTTDELRDDFNKFMDKQVKDRK